jgi:plasmid maintenance system antidote protein VapI
MHTSCAALNRLLDEHDASLTLTTLASTAAIFGTDAQSWVNLQTHYDTGLAREVMADTISKINRYEATHA